MTFVTHTARALMCTPLLALAIALPTWGGEAAGQSPPSVTKTPASIEKQQAYVLGAGDEVSIWALGAEEISAKPVRVDAGGYIDVPLAGRISAEGRTPEQLKAEIVERLRAFVKQPQVTVSVTEFRSRPVSVIGAVNKPGTYQLQGAKTLVEVISMAEGVGNDAGATVRITRQQERGKIPLRNAWEDATGRHSVASVNLRDLMDSKDPALNIMVEPNDVISVSRAQTVYVIGEVRKAGGFALSDRERISVLQALSLAEGLSHNAAATKAKILRASDQSEKRAEIDVNLKQIMAGKSEDVMMQPEDILFVPDNTAKNVALRVAEAAVNIGSGITIWRVGLPRP